MSDDVLVKMAKIETGVSTTNKFLLQAIGTLSKLSTQLDNFVANPDDVEEIETTLVNCAASIDVIKTQLAHVISDVLGIESDSENVSGFEEEDGIRLK